MPLPEDWRAFIESLNSNGVEYVIVGAVALAYHGFPRYTGDLDVLVRNSPENPAMYAPPENLCKRSTIL
jgi:hypothetical protein